MLYVADTHALIWLVSRPSLLGCEARRVLTDHKARIAVCSLSLSEIAYAFNAGRVKVDSRTVLNEIEGAGNVIVVPLTAAIAHDQPAGLNIHDGIIVATTQHLAASEPGGAALITVDTQIRKSGLVATVW